MDETVEFRRDVALLVAAVCFGLLALVTWSRWLGQRHEPGCQPQTVDTSAADYTAPGAWQLPDGTVLGWSRQEDTTIYPHPGCY